MRRLSSVLVGVLLVLFCLPSPPAEAATTNYRVMVSRHADRSHAVPLAGMTVGDGPSYLFLNSSSGIRSVYFEVAFGVGEVTNSTDNVAPFDVFGTAADGNPRAHPAFATSEAIPKPLDSLSVVTTTISRIDGSIVTLRTSYAYLVHFPTVPQARTAGGYADVTWPAVPGAASYTLQPVHPGYVEPIQSTTNTHYRVVAPSSGATRISAIGAHGTVISVFEVYHRAAATTPLLLLRSATGGHADPVSVLPDEVWSGDIFAFIATGSGSQTVRGVSFLMSVPDNLYAFYSQNEFDSTFDLAGTNYGVGRAFDTTMLVDGYYNIRIIFARADGRGVLQDVRVKVSNGIRRPPV